MPSYKETTNQHSAYNTDAFTYNSKYTEMIAINGMRLVSKYDRQYEKGRSHRSIKLHNTIVVYNYGNHLLFFNVFYLMLFLNFRLFISFFLQIFPATPIRSSKVYFIFLISVFAIFSINNLNVCHRNFDVNRNHYNCTTFTTEILDTNRVRHNCGEMAEITYPHFDQHYSKYIFRNSISHNLQRAEGNGDNIKFYWINFITSLLFLCKQFYNPKLKVIIIISSLIHLVISPNTLSVSFDSVSIILNLKSSPTHELNFHSRNITYHLQNY